MDTDRLTDYSLTYVIMTAHHYLFLELFLTARVDTAGFSAPQSDMTLESVLLHAITHKEFTI